MDFNNAGTPEISLYHDALFWTGASEDEFGIVDFTRSANFALDTVLRKIFKADGRWQYDDANNEDLPIATTDLMANQESYTFADSHLKATRVRVKDKNGNWVTLSPTDRKNMSDTQLAATGVPSRYDKLGRSIFPLPIPDYGATGGVELTFQRGSNYFESADTDKKPGIPTPFHRYISLLPAKDYIIANTIENKLQPVLDMLEIMDDELLDFFSSRDRDEAPSMELEETTELY